MGERLRWGAMLMAIGVAVGASAVVPGTDVLVPAAARGNGAAGSVWVTALYVSNPGDQATNVTLSWLDRSPALALPPPVAVTIEAGATEVWEDVIDQAFGFSQAGGAVRVTADDPVVVSAAIVNRGGDTEFGQGFEGVPVVAATPAGSVGQVVGVVHDGTARTNVYLVDASGSGSRATVELLDLEGNVLAAKQYTLAGWQPVLESLDRLGGAAVSAGTLRVQVTEGAVIAGASRVNAASGDPITLTASAPVLMLDGWAPDSLTGRHFLYTAFEDGDETIVDLVFETAATGSFVASGEAPQDFTYSEYRPLADVATMTMTAPFDSELNEPQEVAVLLIWTSATEGYFTAIGTDEVDRFAGAGLFEEVAGQ